MGGSLGIIFAIVIVIVAILIVRRCVYGRNREPPVNVQLPQVGRHVLAPVRHSNGVGSSVLAVDGRDVSARVNQKASARLVLAAVQRSVAILIAEGVISPVCEQPLQHLFVAVAGGGMQCRVPVLQHLKNRARNQRSVVLAAHTKGMQSSVHNAYLVLRVHINAGCHKVLDLLQLAV